LQNGLAATTSDIENYKSELEQQKLDNEQITQELYIAKEKLLYFEQAKQKVLVEHKRSIEERATMQQQIEDLIQELDIVKHERDSIAQQLENNKIESPYDEVNKIDNSVLECEFNSKYTILEKEKQILEKKIQELQRKQSSMDAQLRDYQECIQCLEEEKQLLEQEKDKEQKQICNSNNFEDQSIQRNNERQIEIEKLINDKEVIQLQLEEKEASILELQQKNMDLSKRVEDLTRKFKEQHRASILITPKKAESTELPAHIKQALADTLQLHDKIRIIEEEKNNLIHELQQEKLKTIELQNNLMKTEIITQKAQEEQGRDNMKNRRKELNELIITDKLNSATINTMSIASRDKENEIPLDASKSRTTNLKHRISLLNNNQYSIPHNIQS